MLRVSFYGLSSQFIEFANISNKGLSWSQITAKLKLTLKHEKHLKTSEKKTCEVSQPLIGNNNLNNSLKWGWS